MSRGRNETEKLQLAFGARPEQGGPVRMNWRGIAMERASDFGVRLLMVNSRVTPVAPVACGPNWASLATIWRAASSTVSAPVSETANMVVAGAPLTVVITGIVRVPAE